MLSLGGYFVFGVDGGNVKFTKPPTTIDQQVALLIQRGMQGDRAIMAERLRCTNYYRLSAYWFTFRR